MRWRLPLVMGAGQLWTFIADVRGDAYRLETPTATATRKFTTSAYASSPFTASSAPAF